MAIKFNKPAGAATVSATVKQNGAVVSDTTQVEPVQPAGEAEAQVESIPPLAEVEIGMGVTENLGDMRFLRLDVKLRMPAPVPEIDETYYYAKKWVEERLNALQAENTGG